VDDAPSWDYRGDYIATRSKRRAGETDIHPRWAVEAYLDVDAIRLDPDPASRTGLSVRTIGYSPSARLVITVITVTDGDIVVGVNAWASNSSDRRRYERP